MGIYNTGIGYLLYTLILALTGKYLLAYSLTYIIVGLKALFLYSRVVFRKSLDFKKVILFPFGYILQYFTGLLFLYIFVDLVGVSEYLAALLVIPVTTLVTYLYNKFIFTLK